MSLLSHRGWAITLWVWVWVLLLTGAPALAHDLAIDQLMLWPDRQSGVLRGELTFDPELTRDKDAQPSDEHARRVVEFLSRSLQVTLDERAAPLAFEVRELWVRGGATLGDVVRFSTPLAGSVRELRVRSAAFEALVVSLQRSIPPESSASAPRMETTSWLLGANDWTPVYRVDAGWQALGWRLGGPDVFADAAASASASANADATSRQAATAVTAANPDGVSLSAPAGDASLAGAAGGTSPVGAGEASAQRLAARFVQLGFEHILPGGIDHVLFVAGLVLAQARRYRQVLISLSLFTLAHTLTLALSGLELVQVPSQVVEPLIAISIVVLGIDNLRATREPALETPPSVRYLVVFCFGLVHGLGFASALSELSFGADRLVLALFSFNLGVELGQVAVVLLLALLLHALRRVSIGRCQTLERYATLAGSAAIAVAGLLMVVERVSRSEAPDASASVPAPSILAPSILAPFDPAPAVSAPTITAPSSAGRQSPSPLRSL